MRCRRTTPHEKVEVRLSVGRFQNNTGGEVKKHACIEEEHFSIPSLNNHFATSMNFPEEFQCSGEV